MKHEMTAEEKEARKAARRDLLKKLEKLNAIERAEMLQQWEGRTVEGHALSENNRLLLQIQAAALGVSLSEVGGFRQWKMHGRKVKAGARGMVIFFPMERRRAEDSAADGEDSAGDSADGERRGGVFFRAVYVWDRSQTEAMTGVESAAFRRRARTAETQERARERVRVAAAATIPERTRQSAPDFAARLAAKIQAAMCA